jgi:hypothetical protein
VSRSGKEYFWKRTGRMPRGWFRHVCPECLDQNQEVRYEIVSKDDWIALWQSVQNRGLRARLRPMLEAAKNSQCSDCLEWPGFRSHEGYGKIQLNGSFHFAHRLTCAHAHGDPPLSEHHAAHSCHNPSCVNPRHLRWATPMENFQDQLARGPLIRKKGEANHRAKLSESDAIDIRTLANLCSQEQLAKAFGVSLTAVQFVIRRVSWKHLP